jgi:hypothetical protein
MSGDLVLTDRAALALRDEAELALAAVDNPEDAKELLLKVQLVEEAERLAQVADERLADFIRLRLRAKRRWGELLGVPEQARDEKGRVTGSHMAPAERKRRQRARELAGIPEPVFAAHLEQGESDKLSEASLFRMVNTLRRLEDPAARRRAWNEAVGKARDAGRAVATSDVKAAVDARLSSPHPEDKAVQKVSDFVATCRHLLSVAEGLKVEEAAQRGPQKAAEWVAVFSETRDALDELIERTQEASR